MRGILATLLAIAAALSLAVPGADAATGSAQGSLTRSLNSGMRQAGGSSGAYVVDLTTGQTLYSHKARAPRLPASVEKLYTTSTALIKFGPASRLETSVLGKGTMNGSTFDGTLYLRGGGDPTFGTAGFDRQNYRAGATVQQLVKNLIRATGIHALKGSVVADETLWDSLRGTPATGYAPSIWVEGELSALAFDRGWADAYGATYYAHPAIEAGQQFVYALKTAGVHVPGRTKVRAGRTPTTAQPMAVVRSPRMSTMIALTNAPSDNFFAESLIKDLGAHFGTGGTTSAGAAVVRATIAASFGLHPRLNDGSGLSLYDRTTPYDVVSLLRQQAADEPFTSSLAVAGRTGTLKYEMQGTYAQGRCRGKTGTLSNVSNVVGYCQARDGHTLAYALLMNRIDPNYAHPIQDRMQVALARYDG
jgi:D-alanyl-D-alanine carboxypeptidase/D-alanyl-D-alanine-endopeptidase (penicillin-binding protein 4)